MLINVDKFVDVLLKSSLSLDEQKAVISMLKKLSNDQISDLYQVLLDDAKNLEKILMDFDNDVDKLLLKTNIN